MLDLEPKTITLIFICSSSLSIESIIQKYRAPHKSQPVHRFFALVVISGMLALPEGCIAAVISFTTPRDACHLACVSTTFRSAADSDIVWDRFLPPKYSSSSSSSSSNTWSALWKKELYFRTCHNLIHKGKMIISMFGKNKCRVLCFVFLCMLCD